MLMHLLALLLSIATSGASGQVRPAPPAPPPDVNEPPSAADVARLLSQIQDVPRWTTMAQNGDAFMLGNEFNSWSRAVIWLSRLNRTDEVDRLCDAIVALHARLPTNSVQPRGNIAAISFVRDAFRIGNSRVEVAQYWVPEPYDSNDPTLTKLYRFSVYNGKDEERRYYLEHDRRGEQDSYLLSKIDPKTDAHTAVQPYGHIAPTYWMLLRHVLRDINDPNPPMALY